MTELVMFEASDGGNFDKLATELEAFADALQQLHMKYGLVPIRGFYLERAAKDIRGAAASIRKQTSGNR